LLETEQAGLDRGDVGEVVGGEDPVLHDGEVDLHLVETGQLIDRNPH
jgi:hypothetical protein